MVSMQPRSVSASRRRVVAYVKHNRLDYIRVNNVKVNEMRIHEGGRVIWEIPAEQLETGSESLLRGKGVIVCSSKRLDSKR